MANGSTFERSATFARKHLNLRIGAHLPEGTSELMCHSGHCDIALPDARTRLLTGWEEEMEALISVGIQELVKEQKIQLDTYRDLSEAA